jgi:hypothetical protein
LFNVHENLSRYFLLVKKDRCRERDRAFESAGKNSDELQATARLPLSIATDNYLQINLSSSTQLDVAFWGSIKKNRLGYVGKI